MAKRIAPLPVMAQLQGTDVDASVTFTGSKWKAY